MTALSDALEAAQARAVAVLAKQYVAQSITDETMTTQLASIGLLDGVDVERWLSSLRIIRAGGGDAPTEQEPKKEEPATESQLNFIRDLCERAGVEEPNKPLTKATAHQVIEELQAGSYDPAKWTVPF